MACRRSAVQSSTPPKLSESEQLSLKLPEWRLKPRKALRFLSSGWLDASQTLQVLLAAHVQTNVYHFNAALGAVARAQLWPQTQQMLSSMLSTGVADRVTLNTAMHACEKGNWQLAHELLLCVRVFGGVPSAISYNSCISACARTAWRRVLCLANAMSFSAIEPDPGLHSL